MYIRLKAKLLPLDTELERTRNMKKVRIAEVSVMEEQEETQQNTPAIAVERPQR